MKDFQKIDGQVVPNKLLWFDEAKISALIEALKNFTHRKSHYLVVRRAMSQSLAEYLSREYCKKISSYADVIKRSYIKSGGAVYAILNCVGACITDALEHQDKILRVGEALAVFDANIDAVLNGGEKVMDYSQISETRRKEEEVKQTITAQKTVNFAEALESGDEGDIEKAIAESVKQKELLDKTSKEAQKNQKDLEEAQNNLEQVGAINESMMYQNATMSNQMDANTYNSTSFQNVQNATPSNGYTANEGGQASPHVSNEQTAQVQADTYVNNTQNVPQPQNYQGATVEPQGGATNAQVWQQNNVNNFEQPQQNTYVTPQQGMVGAQNVEMTNNMHSTQNIGQYAESQIVGGEPTSQMGYAGPETQVLQSNTMQSQGVVNNGQQGYNVNQNTEQPNVINNGQSITNGLPQMQPSNANYEQQLANQGASIQQQNIIPQPQQAQPQQVPQQAQQPYVQPTAQMSQQQSVEQPQQVQPQQLQQVQNQNVTTEHVQQGYQNMQNVGQTSQGNVPPQN